MYIVLFLNVLILSTSKAQGEKPCAINCKSINAPVCGSDGRTYGSICALDLSACQTGRNVKVACNGLCPCKDDTLDQNLSSQIPHEVSNINTYNMLKYSTDSGNVKKELSLGKCPLEELRELPVRLIDWFHVLKINQRQKEFTDQRIEGEELLPRMQFSEAKLKALYSTLACIPQANTETAQLVCLEPVKWMFSELDTDGNNALSMEELKDIEHIKAENCIKPFISGCDADKDGYVVLSEFCACLCTTPPCTRAIQSVSTILLGDEPKPIGKFTPTCDEDGFFAPMQCNRNNDCWCVDRNGAEIKGTRTKGLINCESSTTNRNPEDLIALDMRKENE